MDRPLPHQNVLQFMKLRKRNDTSDESLIAVFESLFHEYWAPIYRLLLRMVTDPAEAEDLALETFWRLYASPCTLPGSTHAAGLQSGGQSGFGNPSAVSNVASNMRSTLAGMRLNRLCKIVHLNIC
jgi:ribosomal protein L30/L7E